MQREALGGGIASAKMCSACKLRRTCLINEKPREESEYRSGRHASHAQEVRIGAAS